MLWQEEHTCLYTWKPLRMLKREKVLRKLKIPLHPETPGQPACQLRTWCGPRKRGGHGETTDSWGGAAPGHWHSQQNAAPLPALHYPLPACPALTASPSARGKSQTSKTRILPARAPLSARQDTTRRAGDLTRRPPLPLIHPALAHQHHGLRAAHRIPLRCRPLGRDLALRRWRGVLLDPEPRVRPR